MNAQGDVIALLDENYNIVVKYTYDTWGKVLSVTNASGTLITDTTHIGHRNPIRYRGYYYDIETELYYLQSRYYDPEVGRFISCDAFAVVAATPDNVTETFFCGLIEKNEKDSIPILLAKTINAGGIAAISAGHGYDPN